MSDYGNLKPDDDLTDVFTSVLRDVSADDYGSVKSGTNTALLLALHMLKTDDPDAVQYHLQREGYDSLQELQDAVRGRQQQDFVLDPSDVLTEAPPAVDNSDFTAELTDADQSDGGD